MIEIHQPEIEALIYKRLNEGAFGSVEEVLLQALQEAPLHTSRPSRKLSGLTGADIIAAFQRSPCKEISLEREFPPVTISDPVRF